MAEACQLHAVVSWQSRRRLDGLSGAPPVVRGGAGEPGGRGLGGGAWAIAAGGWGRRPAGLVPPGLSSAGARPRLER